MMTQPTAHDVAKFLSAPLLGEDRVIASPAPLARAERNALTFVTDVAKYADDFARAARAGAVIIAPAGTVAPADGRCAVIQAENPRAAFGLTIAAFFAPRAEAGVAASAVVHPDAIVDPSAHVGEFSVIRAGARIGAGAEIRDHVVIGRNVIIGPHSLVKSHAVIGEEGFGIEKDAEGNNFHVPHIGSVRLGAHVEVGNFTTVCSGTIDPTEVGDYTKIDDHVHIAHNCRLGRNVIVTACAEVSGSVTIEDGAWLGPNVSVIQGLTLGRNSLLGIGAVATKSIPENEVRVGNPARRLGDNTK